MNKQHPFGLPLWKPALYKKSRSVVRKANSALHSSPSSSSELFLNPGNILWLLLFGWWLALVIFLVSLPFIVFHDNYGMIMRELSLYMFWPFGRYVERLVDITPSVINDLERESVEQSLLIDDDDEYDQETQGLLHNHKKKKMYNLFHAVIETIRLGPAACFYYIIFYTFICPLLLLVSSICWMCVVTVPMAKLNYILVRHLRRHPLSLRFRSNNVPVGAHHPTVILLCTYQAFGWQYYKYTYDGINIMFINLLPLVFFVIFDDYVLKEHLPDSFITSPHLIFGLSLASVIPLSYFIGMGVSSISAQSSMGLGAVINATFGSIIEIILYGAALMAGKSSLVEGSLIGSILAGVLLMPGCSMISGAVKRKEQRFNAKSAGVTATMLIMAIIGALSPTLFYQFFGSFELRCTGCPDKMDNNANMTLECSHCYYDQMDPTQDPVYQNNVKPFMYICAAILPSAYIIGLLFSLHTHADMVWKSSNPKHDSHEIPAQQRVYPVHIIRPHSQELHQPHHQNDVASTNIVIPVHKQSSAPLMTVVPPVQTSNPPLAYIHAKEPEEEEEEEAAAGHDSPNWGKMKSYTVLFGCTLLYSIIAEILVQTVDEVMEKIAIDEKFLGLTLFALVPNITEFMNAISFALYGNIVLSMEIGSAYALQVCLLQIPAMVAFSLWYNLGKEEIKKFTFNLIFPRWDIGNHRLIILNPYKPLDLLNDATLEAYGQYGYKNVYSKQEQDPEPHVYDLATKVYLLLRRRKEDQAIVLSGISGSGKSTTHKHLIKELLYLSTHSKRDEKMKNQLLGANTILNSFLKAGQDASCSGLFQTLQFNERGRIVGFSNSIFLFDKYRLTRPQLINFNVFYQLLAGTTADEKQALHITHSNFHYIKPQHQQQHCQDEIEFGELKMALKHCGFKSKTIDQIFQLLASILHLGNIQFIDKRHARISEKDTENGLENGSQDSCRVKNKETLALVAAALGVTTTRLENTLTHQSKLIGNEFCTAFLTIDTASQQRDALAQTIFTAFVYWIVNVLNQRFTKKDDDKAIHTISILDTIGLNTKRANTFHDMCVNYTSERLYNFLLCTALQESEPVHESSSMLLFHAESGLFARLNSESRRLESHALDTSDSHFLSTLFQSKKSSADYRALLDPSTPSCSFSIKHFGSCNVDYSVDGCLENNLDAISPDFIHLFKYKCTNTFVTELFDKDATSTSWITEVHPRDKITIVKAQLPLWLTSQAEQKQEKIQLDENVEEDQTMVSNAIHVKEVKKIQTVLDQMTFGVELLQHQLSSVRISEIIHIQPNSQQKPGLFDDRHVTQQLHYFKVLELIKKSAHVMYSYTPKEILNRYGPLISHEQEEQEGSDTRKILEWIEHNRYTERQVKIDQNLVWLSFRLWRTLENQIRAMEKEVRMREKEIAAAVEAEKEAAKHAAMMAAIEAEEYEAAQREAAEVAAAAQAAELAAIMADRWSSDKNPFDDDCKSDMTPDDDRTYFDYQLDTNDEKKSDWHEDEKDKVLSKGYGPNLDTSEMMKDKNAQLEEQVEEVTITNIRIWWTRFVYLSTWWIPSFVLKHIGKMSREDVQMAWREKVTLCILIFCLSGGTIFCIVGLGVIVCSGTKDLYTSQDVLNHQSMNDYWISIRGKVYDITKFVAVDHGSSFSMAGRSSLEPLAGRDLSYTFPPPLTVACAGLVTDPSVAVTPNGSIVLGPFVHFSGPQQNDKTLKKLHNPGWIKNEFEPLMNNYKKGDLVISMKQIKSDYLGWGRLIATIDERVYDLTDYMATARRYATSSSNNHRYLHPSVENIFIEFGGKDITDEWNYHTTSMNEATRILNKACLDSAFYVGRLDFRESPRCTFANYLLLSFAVILSLVILVKFLAALQFGGAPTPEDHDKFVICQVPCYTEDEESLRKTIDSLAAMTYDDKHKLLFLVADGMIIGSGNDRPTPRILLDILGYNENDDPEPLMFKSIGEGSKQLNYGKVYSGVYRYEGHVVPYVVVVKVGKPSERVKPGNRGKRDSQIICMSFLNKVHFDAEMSPLELEIYYHIKHVIGIDPDLYEYILMVDSDTEVYPDALNRLVSCMLHDSRIIGLCGETELGNQDKSWATMIQVYEYYISHHLVKSFESLFGSVTCLPGCFCMYRIRTASRHIPLIVSPNIIQAYSDNRVDTLHKKNLLHLGEDRYLTTLMMKNFPEYKMMFTPYAKCKTVAPDEWHVLLSQRRRWINSTIHNLLELVLLQELCGFCCLSMRFVVMTDLIGTVTLPSSVIYLIYLVYEVVSGSGPIPTIALGTLAAAYGLQSLIFIFKRQWQHIGWMIIYIFAIPIFSFFIPLYAFWHFDDFSWGNTRVVVGDNKKKQIIVTDDEKFEEKMIPMKKWAQHEREMNETTTFEQVTTYDPSICSQCSCEEEETNSVISYRGRHVCTYHKQVYDGLAYDNHETVCSQSSNDIPNHTNQLLSPLFPAVEDLGEFSVDLSSVIKPPTTAKEGERANEIKEARHVMIPEEDEIEREIHRILLTSDLMTLTKKQVRDQLSELFGIDLTIKRPFINSTIERLLEKDVLLNSFHS
ncbi:hypothetical protein G6F58_000136 [Rhizopus delemar]|nr:hypothetical protein G6F58_000136 [Rhizopus delemar]